MAQHWKGHLNAQGLWHRKPLGDFLSTHGGQDVKGLTKPSYTRDILTLFRKKTTAPIFINIFRLMSLARLANESCTIW
jgi:hypothetical protein